MQQAEIFDDIYREYLNAVSKLDLGNLKDRLAFDLNGEEAVIPFLGMPHRVSSQGIVNHIGIRPGHSVSVVLCKYLLMCPQEEPVGSEWVAYRDFKSAAPFVGGFLNNAEKPISHAFAGRLPDLERASQQLGGRAPDMTPCASLGVVFDALPKVQILMLFYDQDEEFPARCSLLFQRRAEKYLDMECLAITGWRLADWLIERANLR